MTLKRSNPRAGIPGECLVHGAIQSQCWTDMLSTCLMKAWCMMKRFKESTVNSFYFLNENIKHATSSIRAFDELWFETYQFNSLINANGANVLLYQLFLIDRFSKNSEKTYLVEYVETE